MSKSNLIVISVFIFLLSSFSVYADTEYSIGNWIPLDKDGKATDHLSRTVMWKLKDTNYWVSSLRNKGSDPLFYNWVEANKFCETSNYSGFSDWRLPSIVELKYFVSKKIIDINKKQGMEDIGSYFVWSLTPGKRDNEKMVISTRVGHLYSEDKDMEKGLFFCVRKNNEK